MADTPDAQGERWEEQLWHRATYLQKYRSLDPTYHAICACGMQEPVEVHHDEDHRGEQLLFEIRGRKSIIDRIVADHNARLHPAPPAVGEQQQAPKSGIWHNDGDWLVDPDGQRWWPNAAWNHLNALEARIKALAGDHSNNLAVLAGEIGDLRDAERRLKTALAAATTPKRARGDAR